MSIHPEQHPLDGKLEPETKDCFNDRAPLYSIAISLKRIADAPSEVAARITELETRLGGARGGEPVALSATWRACHVMTGDCKKCPSSEIVGGEECVRACFHHAVEVINTVETGNPWRKTEAVKAPWVPASPAEPSGWPEKIREFIDNWFAPWGSWKTEWWEDVSRDREMTHANALLVLRGLLPPTSEGGGA